MRQPQVWAFEILEAQKYDCLLLGPFEKYFSLLPQQKGILNPLGDSVNQGCNNWENLGATTPNYGVTMVVIVAPVVYIPVSN